MAIGVLVAILGVLFTGIDKFGSQNVTTEAVLIGNCLFGFSLSLMKNPIIPEILQCVE